MDLDRRALGLDNEEAADAGKLKPYGRGAGLEDFDHFQLGARLKYARRLQGLRLKDLARVVGCSESFLSKVENDKVKPSLQMLHAIVLHLNTSIGDLFSPLGGEKNRIMRLADRPVLETGSPHQNPGVKLESLVPSATLDLLFGSIHVVEPGGGSAGMITHQGEELGYILQGELELTIEEVTYYLYEGDSFFFQCNLPHGYRNPGEITTKVIWVNTPPTF